MATSTISGVGEVERHQLVAAGVRALLSTAAVVAVYYLVPLEHRSHLSVALRLAAGVAVFVSALIVEIRAIRRHPHPLLRAGVAMALLLPLFLIVFAWIYLTMSAIQPGTFGHHLGRTEALYFTVTVFATVGFGDIVPKNDVARLVVTFQMLADLAFLAVVVRLLFGVASRTAAGRQLEARPGDGPGPPPRAVP